MEEKIYYEREALLEYAKNYVTNPYTIITLECILDAAPKVIIDNSKAVESKKK